MAQFDPGMFTSCPEKRKLIIISQKGQKVGS